MADTRPVKVQPTREARRDRLRAGNTIAIEPMLHAGTSRYRTKSDGWSIVTADGKRAAHVEHAVAVTDDGPVILTPGSPTSVHARPSTLSRRSGDPTAARPVREASTGMLAWPDVPRGRLGGR